MIKHTKDELCIWQSIFNARYFFFLQCRNSPPLDQGLLITEASRSHSVHHTQQDSSGRVISRSQRPLPDNTTLRQTSMSPGGSEPAITGRERPRTHGLYHTATGIGCGVFIRKYCSKFTLHIYRDRKFLHHIHFKIFIGALIKTQNNTFKYIH